MNNINTTINRLTTNINPSEVQLIDKMNQLHEDLESKISEGLIIAFSGGVDSAFLLWAAKKILDVNGGKLLALTTDSPSLPRAELNEAIEFADILGVDHKIEKSYEFDDPDYLQNDLNRCYFCKKELFRLTGEIIDSNEYKWVAYGYNDSDRSDFRPGHKAALENEIIAPLADVGLTKDEIRKVLKTNGINLSDKPSNPCLSSRIMTGISISEKRLHDIEELEIMIEQADIKIKRVRICRDGNEDFLRIEIGKDEMKNFLDISEQIANEGKSRGYKWVTLDLSGYKMGGGVK
ncbi:ATP-utilizing enzyme of the PP-loop superfamily [hydrothermal vent metagenome]|uniref:ATP-utilizing enzyme of the PP-loop superfamily n=1 Tax=hydrothermal vent metagenome TaxID=652676 RepID=A0A3B1D328_9ZZZZ